MKSALIGSADALKLRTDLLCPLRPPVERSATIREEPKTKNTDEIKRDQVRSNEIKRDQMKSSEIKRDESIEIAQFVHAGNERIWQV